MKYIEALVIIIKIIPPILHVLMFESNPMVMVYYRSFVQNKYSLSGLKIRVLTKGIGGKLLLTTQD